MWKIGGYLINAKKVVRNSFEMYQAIHTLGAYKTQKRPSGYVESGIKLFKISSYLLQPLPPQVTPKEDNFPV